MAAAAASVAFASRNTDVLLLSREQAEGMGARVRRSIGRPELRSLDPFLMLDEFKGQRPAGFPDHPHRGFETVSYLMPWSEGSFSHEDFCGHKGTLRGGDLQWMTAGRGIVHSEMPADEHVAHGLQLWVNLPAKSKMMEPRYQELKAEEIPHVTKDGVKAIVIAGTAFGVESPVRTITPVYYIHFDMEPNSTLQQEIPETMNGFCYVLEGEAQFGAAGTKGEAHYTISLTKGAGQTGLLVRTGETKCNFVLVAGEPIGEPVVQHGPFVMNTKEEILQAFYDYQKGKNGFERAPGWQSHNGQELLDY